MAIARHPLVAAPRGAVDLTKRAVTAFASAVREWRVQQAMGQLEQLDDAGLRDIGLTPGSIEHAVRYGRRGLGADGAAGRTASGVPRLPLSLTEWR